jgi:hypothetical protein
MSDAFACFRHAATGSIENYTNVVIDSCQPV